MAEIFLARREGPEGFARDLVVKRILPHLAEDPQFTAMFLEEARIAARLTHPNVVQVFDFGEVDSNYYLVMELVRGVDLRALINRARDVNLRQRVHQGIPAHHAAKVASLVCEGLAHAHHMHIGGRPMGLVHRDITPSNVLISFEGAVKLTDFGIVKSNLERDDATEHGVVKGKYTYMSPEQARGHPLDARSDIFNMGIMLFEALAGQMLFPPHDSKAAKRMSASGQIPRPERIDRFPPELGRIVRKALAADRAHRYPDALSLRADLELFLRGWPEHSDPVEIGDYVRSMFPDVLEEDQRAPRAAGTIPATLAEDPDLLPGAFPLPDLGAADTAIGVEARQIPTVVATPRSGGALGAGTAGASSAGTVSSPATSRWPAWMLWVVVSFLLIGIMVVAGAAVGALFRETPVAPSVPPREPPPPDDVEVLIGPIAAAPGMLLVGSEPPGLVVFINGEDRGPAPIAMELPSEVQHRVELRDGDRVVARDLVTLDPGETRELALESSAAEQGTLRVVSTPSRARVAIDGEHVGETPLEMLLRPGRYRVEVSAEGHVAQQGEAVLADPTETATLTFALPAATVDEPPSSNVRRVRGTGTLAIATTPWSEVYLGGRKLGTTPIGSVTLPAGVHTLTLRSPGRSPRRERVVIRPNQQTRVRLAL